MAYLTRFLWRFLYYCILCFVSVSVVYTTSVLFFSPLMSLAFKVNFNSPSRSALSSRFFVAGIKRNIFEPRRSQVSTGGKGIVPKPAFPLISQDSADSVAVAPIAPLFNWVSSVFTRQHGLGHSEPITVDARTVVSKAFSSSMRPSNVIPYFYRASGSFNRDDITVTTLITSNRFEVFARLVEKYRGPISVTVHITDAGVHTQAGLDSLHDMYTSSDLMTKYVDVHLVVDAFDRQFNTWRNMARLFARTEYVMMLDIDFYPCTDFRDVVRRALNATILQKLDTGRAALVVPAFEYTDFHAGTRYMEFPNNKADLLSLVHQKKIGMFHSSWSAGHNNTNYKRFYAAAPGDVYLVTQYQTAYEPYVIFKRNAPPWCDERFIGYGGNKAACLFEMYLSGISFYVLADQFIIHQNHLYEETMRKNERKYNRKIYADFKEEICIRYLKRFHDTGMISSDPAMNALSECKKMKSSSRILRQYFRDLDIS